MRRILFIILSVLLCNTAYAAKDFAKRFPTDTAMEVYTPNNPPPSSGATPGGSDTDVQFNDSGSFGGNGGFVYNKSNKRVGIQNSNFDSAFHVDNTIGETINPPDSLTASLVQDIPVNAPTSASASVINGPDFPTGFTTTTIYIDSVNDAGQYTNQNTSETGFIAYGQQISYTIYAYRNITNLGVSYRVVNNNPLYMFTFTDPINDGTTPFGMDIGGWSTTNGYQDGFIVKRYDSYSGMTYDIDIGNNTTYNDLGFTNTDSYDTCLYASSGGSYNQFLAQYKTIGGSNYNSANANNVTSDGGLGSNIDVIFITTWSATVNDGFQYETNNGYWYELGTNTAFNDWGQTIGSTVANTLFSSYSFPYFDQSLVTESSGNATQNDGSGSYTANGTSYTWYIYGYKINPINGVKTFESSPYYFSQSDNNDSSNFYWSVSFTGGDANGYVWVNQLGIGADIGNSTSFTDDGTAGSAPSVTPTLGSYTGEAHNYSAYGYTSAPKFSATPYTYSVSDSNPTQGYLIQHTATWGAGTATGIKDILTSGRTTIGYDLFANSLSTAWTETFTSLGDDIVTPSTIGYLANGSNLNKTYNVYAYHTSPLYYSSTYASTTTTDPNDGNYYVVNLTATTGSPNYKFNKVGTGWQDNASTNTFQDNTSDAWNGSSTITPTSAFVYGGLIVDSPQQGVTDIPISTFRNTVFGTPSSFNAFSYNNSGTQTESGRYGINAYGNFSIQSIGNGLDIGTIGTPHTKIGDSSVGTVFNNQASSSAVGSVTVKGSSGTIIKTDPQYNTTMMGTTTNQYPYPTQLIAPIGNQQGLMFYTNNGSSNSVDMATLYNYNYGGIRWGLSNEGSMGIGKDSSSGAWLDIAGSTSLRASLHFNPEIGSDPPSVAGNMFYTGSGATGLYFMGPSAAGKQLVGDAGTGKTGYWWYSDAYGYPISDNKLSWNGSYLQASQLMLFQNGLSMSTGTNFTLNNGTLALAGDTQTGNVMMPYVAKTANYTIGLNDYIVNCTSGTFTLTLPTAVSISGKKYILKNSGSGVITINTTSSQTIDGGSSGSITLAQYDRIEVTSNGANWLITDKYIAASTVTGVSNSDGTITISPTNGAVVASLALGHANTWTGQQVFNNATYIGNNAGLNILITTPSSTTSYSNSGGSGNRSSLIVVTTDLSGSMTGFTSTRFINGDYSTNNMYFNGTTAVSGHYFTFDFGSGSSRTITEAKYYQDRIQNEGVWQWQGSPDNTTWTSIGATFTLGTAATQTITTLSGNVTGYRYYRILGVSGNTSNNPNIYQFDFKINANTTTIQTNNISTPSGELDLQIAGGTTTFGGTLTNTTSTTGIGWSVKTGANTACNTTCGSSACVFGFDTGLAGSDVVNCASALADTCVCAGP